MNNFKKSLIVGALATSSMAHAEIASLYDITPLGPTDENEVFALGLNNQDQVTGYSYLGGGFPFHGFVYDSATHTTADHTNAS